MIKIICDICNKEPDDKDFSFEGIKQEVVSTLIDVGIPLQNKLHKEVLQVCKGCFYKHLSKLFKNEK